MFLQSVFSLVVMIFQFQVLVNGAVIAFTSIERQRFFLAGSGSTSEIVKSDNWLPARLSMSDSLLIIAILL